MTTITYVGHAKSVTWGGLEFVKGSPVQMDTDNHTHVHLIGKARNNPYFEVDAASEAPTPDDGNEDTEDAADLREQLKAAGVTVPGRAGAKWMADKLEEIQNG